jgi:exodeoxyribonuclease VII small subunit
MSDAERNDSDQEALSFGDQEITFDGALDKLEELAAQLEGGDVPLEKALEVYESAVHLFAFCRQRLDGMEQRIEQLSETLDGTLTVEPAATPGADAENG